MNTLDYFDQATLAILRGQGCSPEQALRLARDLVDRRGKFVEEMGLRVDHNGMLMRRATQSKLIAACFSSLNDGTMLRTSEEGEA